MESSKKLILLNGKKMIDLLTNFHPVQIVGMWIMAEFVLKHREEKERCMIISDIETQRLDADLETKKPNITKIKTDG